MNIENRHEQAEDIEPIRRVLLDAFETDVEADLVDRLRTSGALTVSLVAVDGKEVVGHIAFSPVIIESDEGADDGLGLGPMAVVPERQREGIGSRLVEAGLEAVKDVGYDIVVVLGYPAFYTRFGFVPSVEHGIRCEYDAPEGAFMVAELRPGALYGVSGMAKYRPEFDEC